MPFDAVGIVCQDISKSISFYQHLNLEFKEFAPDHWEACTESGIRLMLDSQELAQQLNPQWVSPKGHPMVLCFKQPDAASVDSVYQAIISQGYSSIKEPWDAFWGQRYASVLDPDGNQIDIFSDLPAAN